MIIIDNFNQVAAQIESERGITKEQLILALEQALVSACRKRFPVGTLLESVIEQETGEANIFQVKNIVTKIEDPITEITLKEAKKINPKATKKEGLRVNVTPEDFGRIAALTAKQVIMQRIREAEKNAVYSEYSSKVGQILIGTVQRIEAKNYLLNLGRTEAVLFAKELIPGETFFLKDRVKVYLVDIERNTRGAFLRISRTHSDFLARLFELEIPEIQEGIIEIMSVAREPGVRAKVAVKTNNNAIGAVGTCVGHMGARIQTVIKELRQEKIDVLEWDENPIVFISNALKPAQITKVVILNDKEKQAIVVVPKDQLSLAIGKYGVNVRLAVKLTGWRLDILSEENYVKEAPSIEEKTHVSIVEKIKKEKEKEIEREEAAKKELKKEAIEIPEEDSESGTDDSGMSLDTLAEMLDMDTGELSSKAKEFGVDVESIDEILSLEQVSKIKDNFKK